MASSGHPQYGTGTQQAIIPGTVPQAYYASQPQPQMMYSYEDMQLLQQRLPVQPTATQLQQQMAAASGMYVVGNQGVHPYMMYQYSPSMLPGVPSQYGAPPPLLQYPPNMGIAGHPIPPQYQMQPKMVYANPSHPYYESPLPQDYKTGAYAQSKLVAPRVALNSAPDISAGIKAPIGKVANPPHNSVAVTPSPYSPMIIPSVAPGAAHPSSFLQHQMKPKY